jgi:hypothetical protein
MLQRVNARTAMHRGRIVNFQTLWLEGQHLGALVGKRAPGAHRQIAAHISA